MTATESAVKYAARHIPIYDRYAGVTIGRVVRVGLGDSNQIHSGHGYDYAEQQALIDAGVPIFATELDSIANNNGAGSGQGASGEAFGMVNSDSYALAPAAIQPYLVYPAGFVKKPMFWNSNQNNISARGLDCSPLPAEEAINGHAWYVRDPSLGASWSIAFRRNSAPWTIHGSQSLVQNSGALSVQRVTLALTASGGRAATALGLLAYTPSSSVPKAQMAMLFMAAERASQLRGFMYDTLVFYGGNGLRQYYNVLVNLGEAYLTAYFAALKFLGGADPVLELNIRSGLNDRNDTNAATGSTALSNTEEGYEANLRALIELLRTRAAQGGWGKDQIYFRIRPSHVADNGDTTLAAFRRAADRVAQTTDRAIFIDDSVLLPYSQISAYYYGGSDSNHLTQAGHKVEADEAHESFMRACHNAKMEVLDKFAASVPGIDSPPAFWEAVDPDNNYDIVASRCLWIGQAGDVVVLPVGESSTPVKFENCPAGMLLPGRFRRILETDTTATSILAGR